jgi:UDP-N-acetylmuramate dehydrogenase
VDTRSEEGRYRAWSATALADLEDLCRQHGCTTARDEFLARHTSIGVGGPTPLMIWPRHPEAVAAALEWCAARDLRWRVLGGGTNVLVGDRGVDEPVFHLTSLTDGVRVAAPSAVFPAGIPTAQALKTTLREGLRGLVWATGLPGTVGGAAAGNAGCWGGQMADVVTRLDVVDAMGAWHELGEADLTWRYRSLRLPPSLGAGSIIVAVTLSVSPSDPEVLQQRFEELHDAKRRQQPIGARNAGCIFKNPDPEHPAGRLIDQAGCKGLRVGGAQISEQHGNFLINRGDATSADVEELIRRVREAVRQDAGRVLEEEIDRW